MSGKSLSILPRISELLKFCEAQASCLRYEKFTCSKDDSGGRNAQQPAAF